mmetsp:Transcript_18353/g.73349  ORF Transcript_18353/g.73349 Transcript_18353/m.73349 type:complete len:144 (+) Transcript_18353:78-509(+)
MSSSIIFQDEFRIEGKNPEGKKFEKVDRLVGKGLVYEVSMLVDVNSEIYDVKTEETVTVALASSLGSGTETYEQARGRASLLDAYDYAMCGVAYKYKHVAGSQVEVHISHGGLLARFVGDEKHLCDVKVDQTVYTLVRKAKGL